jgi:hypothetical protein
LLALAGLLSACPDDGPANPPKLWLALVGNDETRVQLVPRQPDPF